MISQAGSVPAPQPSCRGHTPGGHAQGALRAPRRGGLRERNARPRGNSFASRQRCRAAAFVPRTEPRALAQMNKGARAGAKRRAKLRRTNPGRRSRTSGAKPRAASGNTIGPRSATSTRHVRSAASSAGAAHTLGRGAGRKARRGEAVGSSGEEVRGAGPEHSGQSPARLPKTQQGEPRPHRRDRDSAVQSGRSLQRPTLLWRALGAKPPWL